MIHQHHVIRVTAGQARETDDAVVVEDRFELLLNDQPVTEMIASRDQLRELGAGYLVSEGILRCVDKVKIDGARILVYTDTGCDLRWMKRDVGSSGGISILSTQPRAVSDIRLTRTMLSRSPGRSRPNSGGRPAGYTVRCSSRKAGFLPGAAMWAGTIPLTRWWDMPS